MMNIPLPATRSLLLLLIFFAAAHAEAGTPRVVMRPELWQSPVPGALYAVDVPFHIGTHMSKEATDTARDYRMTTRVYHGNARKHDATTIFSGIWAELQIQSQQPFTPTDTGEYRVELIIYSQEDGSYDSLGWTFRATADVKGKVVFTKSKLQDFSPVAGKTYGSEDSIPVRIWITNEQNVMMPSTATNLTLRRSDGRFEYSLTDRATNLAPGTTREVILPHMALRNMSGLAKCFTLILNIPSGINTFIQADSIGGCIGVNYTKPSKLDISLAGPGDTTVVPRAGGIHRARKEYSITAGVRNPSLLTDTWGTTVTTEITDPLGNRVRVWEINTHTIEAKPTVPISISKLNQQDTGTYRITHRLSHRSVPFDSVSWTYRVVEDSGGGFHVRLVTEGDLSYSPADKSILKLEDGVRMSVTVNNAGEEQAPEIAVSVSVFNSADERLYHKNPAPFELMPLERKTLDLPRFHPVLEGVYRLEIRVASEGIRRDSVSSTFTMSTKTSSFDIFGRAEEVIRVIPNPVAGSDEATVRITGQGGFIVSLHDMLGRQVSHAVETHVEGTAAVPLRIEGEAAGLYMVRVVTERGEVIHLPLRIDHR